MVGFQRVYLWILTTAMMNSFWTINHSRVWVKNPRKSVKLNLYKISLPVWADVVKKDGKFRTDFGRISRLVVNEKEYSYLTLRRAMEQIDLDVVSQLSSRCLSSCFDKPKNDTDRVHSTMGLEIFLTPLPEPFQPTCGCVPKYERDVPSSWFLSIFSAEAWERCFDWYTWTCMDQVLSRLLSHLGSLVYPNMWYPTLGFEIVISVPRMFHRFFL